MEKLSSLVKIEQFIEQHKLCFLYVHKDNCSVCYSLLPQVQEVLKQFPKIRPAIVNSDEVPQIASFFSIFTVPALLLFVEGKELLREARFVPIEKLTNDLQKIYEIYLYHDENM